MKLFLFSFSFKVFVLFGLTSLVYANDPQDLYFIRESLKAEIDPIVKGFDRSAYAIIKIIPKTEDHKLPSTPFSIVELPLRDESGAIVLEQVNVRVFTQAEELPENVKKLVEEIISNYGAKPNVTASTLPSNMIQGAPILLTAENKNSLLIVLIFPAISAAFAFVLISRQRKSGPSAFDEIVQTGLTKISDAIEQSHSVDTVDSEQIGAVQGEENSENDAKIFDALEKDSLLALLTDCYWCQTDSYASYIWNRIPIHRRKEVLKDAPFLEKYGRYLCNIQGKNLNRHQEPYFLSPLPIYKIDNEKITEAVRKNTRSPT